MTKRTLLILSLVLLVVYACNKTDTKQFHENVCEGHPAAGDSASLNQVRYATEIRLIGQQELQVRLKGNAPPPDSIVSYWLQLDNGEECYQAKSFKARTENGETYFIFDYIIPTMMYPGVVADWKFSYRNQEFILRDTLQ